MTDFIIINLLIIIWFSNSVKGPLTSAIYQIRYHDLCKRVHLFYVRVESTSVLKQWNINNLARNVQFIAF